MAKLLFIATNEWVKWGGSEFLWGHAAERLARHGNEVVVSAKFWDEPAAEIQHLRSIGCKISLRKPFGVASRLARKVLPLPNYAADHLKPLTTGVDLAVISLSSYWEALPWLEAVRDAKVPYAIVVQGASETLWPADETAEKLAAAFESALRTYFVSQANLDLFSRQLGVPLANGRVVRNPFTVGYDARPGWPTERLDTLSIACVARLDVIQKGQDVLLQVLNLPIWRGRNVRFVLAGDGPNARSLRRLSQMLGLPNVEFAGFVTDMEKFWRRHHALVLPSRFEGMPLALVEAMLCGRAAIATDVAGHRELIRDDVNGFLAKAPTVELLNEAMNRAWESRSRLREMGEQAARDVRQWVGPDPVGDFVRELASLVESVR